MAKAATASQKSSPKKPTSSTSKKVNKSASSNSTPAKNSKGKVPGTELWEFDRIQGHRYTVKPGETFRPNKHVEFLTHWIGKDAKGNPWKPTWEPLANFDDSPENLSDYLAKEKWLKSHIKL